MKRFISMFLVVALTWSGGVFNAISAYADSMPEMLKQGDGYELQENSDGSHTMRFSGFEEASGEPVLWSAADNRFFVAEEDRSLTLNRIYQKNQLLLSDTVGDIGISFAPLMNAAATPVLTQSVVDFASLAMPEADNQSVSNVLQVPAVPENRPTAIEGKLGGGRQSRSASSATPVIYEGLFDAQSDVHLTALNNGVKEDIVIRGYNGNHVYRYLITLKGLTARQSGQEIALIDASGNRRGVIQAPSMTDATGVYSTNITVSLEANGSGYILQYAPDDTWMQNAAYPVTLDPTHQIQFGDSSHIEDQDTSGKETYTSPYMHIGGDIVAYVGLNRDSAMVVNDFLGKMGDIFIDSAYVGY